MRPRRRAVGPGVSPGDRRASRAVVATMATRPAQRRHIRLASSTPSARPIARVDLGSVGTGTASWPVPRSPETATRTCQAPAVIIQRCPVKSRASSDDRDATSGTGANRAPGPVSGSGTMRTSRTSSLVVSTSTSATPGIAYGGLIVTKTRYAPAWPSRKTSGLPMCAATGTRRAATTATRGERGAQPPVRHRFTRCITRPTCSPT